MASDLRTRFRMARLSARRRLGLAPPQECVVRYATSLRVWADPSDVVERHAWLSGSYEPMTARILQRAARPGDTVLDVGAHVGMHTLVLADAVGPNGTVIAFEPNPRTLVRLRRNIEVNDFATRVQVKEVGASSAAGEAALHLSDDAHNSGGASLMGQRSPTATVTVRLDRIDDVVGDLADTVTLIKLDVEGHEAAALAGATRTLRARPAVVFEANTTDAVDALRDAGYAIHELDAQLTMVEPRRTTAVVRPGAGANLVAVVPNSEAAARLGIDRR